jgi:hypothetical protein
MIKKENRKEIVKAEKEINDLLVELERITRKVNVCPIEDLDKEIFLEFKERVYYSRDKLREKLTKEYPNM